MSATMSPWVSSWALRIYESLDCPTSLKAAILLRYGEWGQLAEMRVAAGDFIDPFVFYRSYQACELLRKYPGLPLGIDTAAVALEGWRAAEAQCYRTNERLSPHLWDHSHGGEFVSFILEEIKKEVIYLIGYHPGPFEGRFGPGATVSDPAVRCTIPDKLSSPVSLTFDASPYVLPWSGTHWANSRREATVGVKQDLFSFTRGNCWFSVPKDATTDRSCAKEPSLNAYYQRGLGQKMVSRLKRRGFDLRTLPERHQALARQGSLDGLMCTIDLKSASDTVAYNLVKLLLPEPWFDALNRLRSPMTYVDGKWFRLEKFSSMGNGFTFELETTLFLAIARVATSYSCSKEQVDREVSVFGDDIIVPTTAAQDVMSILAYLGFTPNQRKTFVSGNFRESCGGDFFLGQAVRPYLLKEIPDGPQSFIRIANGIRRVVQRFDADRPVRNALHRSWLRVLDSIPSAERSCRGPEALGDVVIHDDERWWSVRWRGQVRYIRVVRPVARPTVRWDGFGPATQLACALYLAGSGSEKPLLDHRGRLASRGDIQGYKIGWTAYS